jgi:hypothetical protein
VLGAVIRLVARDQNINLGGVYATYRGVRQTV